MEIAEKYFFQQESVLDLTPTCSLREEISRSNYNKRQNIERNLKRMVTKYFSKELFLQFVSSLSTIIEDLKISDEQDGLLLEKLFSPQLEKITKFVFWRKKRKKSPNDLSLQLSLFTKNKL